MVAIMNNKMASTDRDYSPFYNSVFSVMAEDRPSILFVSCTVTSIECNVTLSRDNFENQFPNYYKIKTYENFSSKHKN